MKKPLLAVAFVAVLAGMALAAPGRSTAAQSCRDRSRDAALLTIKTLRMRSQPIRWRSCDLARGPIWDPYYQARPGQGQTMVIDAHDVTPVPGYGAHGPFYRLHLIKPGDLATIKWHGVTRTYRFVTKPFAEWQCYSKKASVDPRRYSHKLICAPNNRPIKNWSVEGFYIRCCWLRYTDYKFLYERAVLIKTQPSS